MCVIKQKYITDDGLRYVAFTRNFSMLFVDETETN